MCSNVQWEFGGVCGWEVILCPHGYGSGENFWPPKYGWFDARNDMTWQFLVDLGAVCFDWAVFFLPMKTCRLADAVVARLDGKCFHHVRLCKSDSWAVEDWPSLGTWGSVSKRQTWTIFKDLVLKSGPWISTGNDEATCLELSKYLRISLICFSTRTPSTPPHRHNPIDHDPSCRIQFYGYILMSVS